MLRRPRKSGVATNATAAKLEDTVGSLLILYYLVKCTLRINVHSVSFNSALSLAADIHNSDVLLQLGP